MAKAKHVPTKLLRDMGHKGKIQIADLTQAKADVREGMKEFPSGRKK